MREPNAVEDAGVSATPDHGSAAPEDGPTDLRRIGRYLVLERLGQGGMGVVYAAYDEQLDRRVAIKLLLPRTAPEDEHARTRIRREAQAMARLSDPAVVHVYEVGEWCGRTYVAMEYVRGETLRAWLTAPRSLEERVDMLVQAAGGLIAAHRAGVVHRDFKPDNVMVDRNRRARVLDFGLARARKERSQRATPSFEAPMGDALRAEITQSGVIMGTPAYMSPEQYMGDPTSPSSDQFTFCVVAYEVLYGLRPFWGTNLRELAKAIMRQRRIPPPKENDVPLALHQVIVRGLNPHPDARWPSMQALVDAVRAATGAPPRRWIPVALAVATVVIMVLLGVLLIRRTPSEPDHLQLYANAANAAAVDASEKAPEFADRIRQRASA